MTMLLRTIKLLAVAWLAAVFDSGLAPSLRLGACDPCACIAAAAICLAMSESSYAFLAAGWFGLAADLSGSDRLGICTATFLVAGYLFVHIRAITGIRHAFGRLVLLLLSTLAMSLGVAVVQRCLAGSVTSWSTPALHSLGIGAYTAACAMPLLIPLSWLRKDSPVSIQSLAPGS